MKVKKIHVKNFRLLKDFKLDFREDMSLVVGKNNCGKTSVVTIMDKLLSSTEIKFSWHDFNLEFQKDFFEKTQTYSVDKDATSFEVEGIKLQIFIEYSTKDNYENIQNFMMNLDPKNNIVVLEFFYSCKEDNLKQLQDDLEEERVSTFEDFSKYMNKYSSKYFSLHRYSREFDINLNEVTDNISNEIKFSTIKKLINIKTIKANREASNKINDSTLSALSQKYYNAQNSEKDIDFSDLQKAITEADKSLSKTYNGSEGSSGIFTEIFSSVKRFGSGTSETILTIQSSISEIDLLKNNTTLYYKSNDCHLPESYNGLGYLNLIGMIFEIETSLAEFCGNEHMNSSDINVLFIEEPEAHTHPQLQYIFIKNIKELLRERKTKNSLDLQTIITTHSSHIVSECDFDDVRYLKRNENSLISKNFQELKQKYDSDSHAFNFVKQYLGLNRSELFFTDKAIFIEGDTERILLPAMMKKIDLNHGSDNNYVPLLSQNISIIEAGAYAHIFKPLIDFLGIKVLIITDIDLATEKTKPDKNGVERIKLNKCSSIEDPTHTTNSSLKNLLSLTNTTNQYNELIAKTANEKIVDSCRIAYQTKEKNYQASSFEDCFICLNLDYIESNKDNFTQGLKHRKILNEVPINFYNIAQKCIAKKSAFATEILYYDGITDGKKWETPNYIKEGLQWLQEQ